jgi:hypothetical protein
MARHRPLAPLGATRRIWHHAGMQRQVSSREFDQLPDARDGLTRRERIVLYVLQEAQKERGDRSVPTAMLWGRVCEYFDISPEGLSEMLARLGARAGL